MFNLPISFTAPVDNYTTLGILGVEGPYLGHGHIRVQFIMHCTNYEMLYPGFMSHEFCQKVGFTYVSSVEGRYSRIRTYLFSFNLSSYLRDAPQFVELIARKIRKHRREVINNWQTSQGEFDSCDMYADL